MREQLFRMVPSFAPMRHTRNQVPGEPEDVLNRVTVKVQALNKGPDSEKKVDEVCIHASLLYCSNPIPS
jgi:hypothetical protein